MGVLHRKDATAGTTGAGVPNENVLFGPMDGICQGNKDDAVDIFFFARYHPIADVIEFRRAFLRRVGNLDPNIWIDGAKEMKTVSLSGWVFISTVINWPPEAEESPDCTNLVPGADLRFCDLSNMNLSLGLVDLSGADLRFSDLSNTDLRFVDLSGANLALANLSNPFLYQADLSDANLVGADLKNAGFAPGQPGNNCPITFHPFCVDFSGANLTRANLFGISLQKADFTDANLSRANLSGAAILDSDFINTDLTRINLDGASFARSLF